MAGISTKQHAAIQALLTGKSVTSTAKSLGVGERTLSRWLAEDEPFQRALRDAQTALIDSTVRRLTVLAESATVALADGLGRSEPTALRMRAAVIVLDKVLQYRQFIELEKRIAALEGEGNGDDIEGKIDED